MTSLQKDILALREKKALVQMGGGEAAIEKQEAMEIHFRSMISL